MRNNRKRQAASNRPAYNRSGSRDVAKRRRKSRGFSKLLVAIVVVLAVAGVYTSLRAKPVQAPAATLPKTTTTTKVATTTQAPVNHCADNSLSQLILVSISARHLWACNGSVQAYDSPVVTGMEFLAADLTPTGTYHIYAKETDIYLKGSDSTGSWDDYVNYWMPFLDNQYGAYGLHDATWRPASAFGNISPDSTNASHGCVECPLATAQWLYNWSEVGTTVTVES
ncbi:MAG TPA: L,D-transpeptidase [Candidatus Binatia bacterium]|nr:L,D-transpeptidase [Candidatus Binatia bacterium]